ncbi:unnamed protein product, partial [Prorocentrum cordatum]
MTILYRSALGYSGLLGLAPFQQAGAELLPPVVHVILSWHQGSLQRVSAQPHVASTLQTMVVKRLYSSGGQASPSTAAMAPAVSGSFTRRCATAAGAKPSRAARRIEEKQAASIIFMQSFILRMRSLEGCIAGNRRERGSVTPAPQTKCFSSGGRWPAVSRRSCLKRRTCNQGSIGWRSEQSLRGRGDLAEVAAPSAASRYDPGEGRKSCAPSTWAVQVERGGDSRSPR